MTIYKTPEEVYIWQAVHPISFSTIPPAIQLHFLSPITELNHNINIYSDTLKKYSEPFVTYLEPILTFYHPKPNWIKFPIYYVVPYRTNYQGRRGPFPSASMTYVLGTVTHDWNCTEPQQSVSHLLTATIKQTENHSPTAVQTTVLKTSPLINLKVKLLMN